jgi:hypothetical protein
MLSAFLGWVLRTVHAAADAEMNDESRLRDALLDAEMRRETGELSEDGFRQIEADVIAQIREIRERRTGGAEPLTMSSDIDVAGADHFQVEASVTGDFHDPDASVTSAIGSASEQRVRPLRTSARIRRPRSHSARAARGTRRR